MSINPLQAIFPTTAVPVPGAEKKNSISALSFDTVLSSLSSAEGSSAIKGQQAAAEMLRIQMMQNSLSLSGDGEASSPSALPALEALLSRHSEYCQASRAPRAINGTQATPAVVPAVVPPATETDIGSIGSTAAHYLGTPYRFGGEDASGIDCSSFVQKVFQEHQINLPRTAREQSAVGTEVADGDLRKGDLVFFHTYASYPSHVGIYLGEGKMIHASSGKGEVTVSDLNSDYYRSRFLGAKRMA
jgi:cell wall-associated NlpC family hydrolase